jgi:DNA-binding MarR family transcriptional regulator
MQYVLGVLRSFGKRIFPKLKKLSEACKLTVATLRRILDELRRDGWLRTERRGPTSSLYILQVPKMAHSLAHSLAHSNSVSLVSEEERGRRKPVSFERLTERERLALGRATPIGGRRVPVPLSQEEQREVEQIMRASA